MQWYQYKYQMIRLSAVLLDWMFKHVILLPLNYIVRVKEWKPMMTLPGSDSSIVWASLDGQKWVQISLRFYYVKNIAYKLLDISKTKWTRKSSWNINSKYKHSNHLPFFILLLTWTIHFPTTFAQPNIFFPSFFSLTSAKNLQSTCSSTGMSFRNRSFRGGSTLHVLNTLSHVDVLFFVSLFLWS